MTLNLEGFVRIIRNIFEKETLKVSYQFQFEARIFRMQEKHFKLRRNLEGYIFLQFISELQTKPSRFKFVNIQNKHLRR